MEGSHWAILALIGSLHPPLSGLRRMPLSEQPGKALGETCFCIRPATCHYQGYVYMGITSIHPLSGLVVAIIRVETRVFI